MNYKILVKMHTPVGIKKGKGAFGKRHMSRGNFGYYDKDNAMRRPCEEYVGFELVSKLLDMGMIEEAKKLFERLS